jgi:hypothetical protein
VSPQYPYVEQHSPPEKPIQVSPTDGPQEASCETPVGVATALLLAVRLAEPDTDELPNARDEDEEEEMPHFPNPFWQPSPQ